MSTQPMHDPRITKHLPNGSVESSVAEPIRELPAGGVLITWTQTGSPHQAGADLLGPGGDRLSVDGFPARLTSGPADAWCASLGGKQSITGSFVLFELMEMTACLADKDAALTTEAETSFRLTKVTPQARAAAHPAR